MDFSYLGALLAAEDPAGSDVNLRVGLVRADFSVLSQVWKHSSLLVE